MDEGNGPGVMMMFLSTVYVYVLVKLINV